MTTSAPQVPCETPPPAPCRLACYRAATGAAAVVALFCVVVGALLAFDFLHREGTDPLDSPRFLELKAQLAEDPKNEQLKQEIRDLDLELRTAYFRQREFTDRGTWLLLGGMIVLVLAAKTALWLGRRPPMPQPQPAPLDADASTARGGRWAVAAVGLSLVAAATTLALGLRSHLPGEPAAVAQAGGDAAPAAVGLPGEEEIALEWPRFRGPGGLGISHYENIPVSWDEAAGQNVLWKTPVPLPGNSSPIVWKDHIFLSGADESRRKVFAFDAPSGKLLWQKDVPGTPQSTAEPPEVSQDTGYAAPTMATDGRRAFAIFANGDVAAFDFSGKLAWSRSLGIPKSSYGYASSLEVFRDLLIIQFDQGTAKEGLSRLLALNTANGQTVWEVHREVPNSWPSPIVIDGPSGKQIITCADPWTIAYRPEDGQEIWRAKTLRQDVGPSPVFASGMVFTVSEYPALSAIRVDGHGDVTASHIAWTFEDGLPDTASPLATADYVFLLATYGILTCVDAKTGEMLWDKEFENAIFNSSPSLVGDKLYLFAKTETEDAQGEPLFRTQSWVVKIGREEPEVVGEGMLEEPCVTSPAFADGRMYIRGERHLFAIGEKQPAP